MGYGNFRHAFVLRKLSHDSSRLTPKMPWLTPRLPPEISRSGWARRLDFHMKEVRFASSSPRVHKTAAEQANRKRKPHASGWKNAVLPRLELGRKTRAKKVSFTACLSSKLQLACTSQRVILTSPENSFDEQDWLQFFCNLSTPEKLNLPIGQVKNRKTKIPYPGISDSTVFAHWKRNN